MQIENNTSHLQETFSDLRRQIIGTISAHSPSKSLALGPVILYVENSEQKCLYNWSEITWDDLKLGPYVRDIIRAIYDVSRILTKYKNIFKLTPDDKKLVQIVSKKSLHFLKKDIGFEFDDYPHFISSISFIGYHVFMKDVSKFVSVISQLPKSNLDKIENIMGALKINFTELAGNLNELFALSEGRYAAFKDLRKIIKEYSDEKNKIIEDTMVYHPKYNDQKSARIAIQRFQNFRSKIIAYKDETSSYNVLMNEAIMIFCDMPQEINSSKAYFKLKQINNEEHLKRSDRTNIRLMDLIYHPMERPYDPKHFKEQYPIYYMTHHFERLFYSDKQSLIRNIIFLPIKFVDSQVIGQTVIISPYLLDKNTVVNTMEAYMPKIKDAARRDFDIQILSWSINASKDLTSVYDEASWLARRLKSILCFEFIIVYADRDGTWKPHEILKRKVANGSQLGTLQWEKVKSGDSIHFQGFTHWMNEKANGLRATGINDYTEVYKTSSLDNQLHDVFMNYYPLSGNNNQEDGCHKIQSFILSVFGKIAFIVFFSEEMRMTRLAQDEISDLFKEALTSLSRIRKKKRTDAEIAVAKFASHDTDKFLSGVSEIIDKNVTLLKKINFSEEAESLSIVNRKLERYKKEMNFILAAFSPKHTEEMKKYYPSQSAYSISEEIRSFCTEYFQTNIFRDYIVERLKSGKGRESYAIRYLNLLEASTRGYELFTIKIPEKDIETKINKEILRILLEESIINAIIHNDWEQSLFDDWRKSPPLVKIEIINDSKFYMFRIGNMIDSKKLKEFHEKKWVDNLDIFYESYENIHFLIIGKTVEAATGQRDVCFRSYPKKPDYIFLEIKIPFIGKGDR